MYKYYCFIDIIMSRIDEAFDSQYEYNYFLNLVLKENDISNITYEQLQERVDNLNYYKTLSNINPYSIYYSTKSNSIQFDDHDYLFRGSNITYHLKNNYKDIIGPSGEYINNVSIYTLSAVDLLKFSKLEIELNRNPFFIDQSSNNINGSFGNGAKCGSLSQILIYHCKKYINDFYLLISNSLENENINDPTNLHHSYVDFSNNYDILYNVNIDNPRPNTEILKKIYSIEHLLLNYMQFQLPL